MQINITPLRLVRLEAVKPVGDVYRSNNFLATVSVILESFYITIFFPAVTGDIILSLNFISLVIHAAESSDQI